MPAHPWTDDPATSSTHVRAVHINELRTAADQARAALGLGSYAWTDNPVGTGTHIRAMHFTELHDVIQDLWTRHGQGTLPNWDVGSAPSPSRQISARDINDLRSWLNQVDPPAAKRGFHCGPYHQINGTPTLQPTFLSQDPSQFHPGMLVVIDNWFMYDYVNTGHGYGDISDSGYATWLKQQQDAGVEVFVRIYRSGTTKGPRRNNLYR